LDFKIYVYISHHINLYHHITRTPLTTIEWNGNIPPNSQTKQLFTTFLLVWLVVFHSFNGAGGCPRGERQVLTDLALGEKKVLPHSSSLHDSLGH
jgi:hypothetical protein